MTAERETSMSDKKITSTLTIAGAFAAACPAGDRVVLLARTRIAVRALRTPYGCDLEVAAPSVSYRYL